MNENWDTGVMIVVKIAIIHGLLIPWTQLLGIRRIAQTEYTYTLYLKTIKQIVSQLGRRSNNCNENSNTSMIVFTLGPIYMLF